MIRFCSFLEVNNLSSACRKRESISAGIRFSALLHLEGEAVSTPFRPEGHEIAHHHRQLCLRIRVQPRPEEMRAGSQRSIWAGVALTAPYQDQERMVGANDSSDGGADLKQDSRVLHDYHDCVNENISIKNKITPSRQLQTHRRHPPPRITATQGP